MSADAREPDLSFARMGGEPVKLRLVLGILAFVLCVLAAVGTLPLWPSVLALCVALLVEGSV